VRKGWRTLAISELGELRTGGTPSTSNPAFWDGPLPWLRPADLAGRTGVVVSQTEKQISTEATKKSSAKLLPVGSVLVSARGTVGLIAVSGVPLAISQSFFALVPKGKIVDFRFLALCLEAKRSVLESMASGNTIKGLSKDALLGVEVDVPPLAEQRRIADMVGAIDRTIEAHRSGVASLTEMSFKVRESLLASAESESPLYRALDGIDAGKSPRALDRPPTEGERGVLKVSAVRPGEFEPWESKTLDEDTVMPERARVSAGDLLITRANTRELVGAVCRVPETPDDLFLCDKTLRLRVNAEQALPEYLVFALAAESVRSQIELNATGTSGSMKNISQQTIRSLRVPLPPLETQAKIAAACGGGAETRRALKRSLTGAIHLRQAILAALVRGNHEIPATYDHLGDVAHSSQVAESQTETSHKPALA
jgi:type I restriction enzyme, S subunit